MQAEQLKRGEWVEYHNHPVEVIATFPRNNLATIWDEQTASHQTINANELTEDPQCHCDSFQYY